ncbi:LuxR family transcriptional regulator [Neorhizobium lilium]|uniref:LuxR family transcriptional regulator n=1 Tax=Neorhizobium lilium TaxID=2503024 RepID=A0A444LC59_9HYPH|nr:LuxR family transcriptional regulator [Neorhizobium lilium]
MNIRSIVQFLILVGESETTDELERQIESLLSTYGFKFYGLRFHRKPHDDTVGSAILGRWPAGWSEIYAARKYPLIDPTIRMLSVAQRPFRWKEAVMALKGDPHRPRMDRMMQDAGRFGLHDGYVFPVHGRNGLLGSMTVGGDAVDLSPAECALFEAAAKLAFWRFMELRGQVEALEDAAKVDTQLTRREMEVILLLADGLTSHEIAKALTISNHTVDWYINGLQEKLKAKNRQHVVALAFRLGLVS